TFQVSAVFSTLSVLDNVLVARLSAAGRSLGLLGRAGPLEAERARALLARVGLAEQGARPAGILAYGDLKKLELALALANDTALLLLDESTERMATHA